MREQSRSSSQDEKRRTVEVGGLSNAFDDLSSLRIFVRVVELESFSEAARRLGVTPATVSKHIAALESRLGTRLVNRTTRRLFVTDAGSTLYEHCVRVMRELSQAQAQLSQLQAEPIGHLRVALPMSLGSRLIGPRLPSFLRQHPRVTVELDLSVSKVDVYEEHIDVAIRIADAVDPGLVAVKLATYRRVFCAAPQYLAEHGVPQSPDDLAQHHCLFSRGALPSHGWPVLQDGRVRTIAVNGRLSANYADPIHDAALAGMGIFMSARWLVDEDLRQGRLVEVLADHAVQNRAIYAVLSQRGAMTPKVRAFVDFMRDCLKDVQ